VPLNDLPISKKRLKAIKLVAPLGGVEIGSYEINLLGNLLEVKK
jgi:hypothetical protein